MTKRIQLTLGLLLAAAGVATGSAIMDYLLTRTIAWNRVLSAALLLVMALGYARYARSFTTPKATSRDDRTAPPAPEAP